MSTDLTLIATSNQLPDYLKNSGLQYEDTGVGSGIVPRAPKLGITTAKQFTISKDGATIILPPDADGVARVRGVLIAGAENITKAWYAKSYVPGSSEAPDCFSNDSKTPAPGVKAPQCSNCASCPKNAFGSHPVTGRGKACADRKMMVFVWEGLPDELITVNFPTMSLQSLKKIDTELRNANIPLQAVLMELSFDPAIMYPVIKIGAKGFVPQETALKLIERSHSAEVSDLLRENEFDDVAPAGEQHQAQPLVPATGSEQSEGQAGAGGAQEEQEEQGAQGSGEAPRRRRRTKAEMEAARAAEEAAKNPGNAASQVAELLTQAAPQQEARELTEIEKLEAQLAAAKAAKEHRTLAPQKSPEELRKEQLLAELAALSGGGANQSVEQKIDQAELAAQHPKQEATQTLANAGGGNVADLLAKWKTGA